MEEFVNLHKSKFATWYPRLGGGIDAMVMLKRNRTLNDASDPFYNPKTGQQNQYLRWRTGYILNDYHDILEITASLLMHLMVIAGFWLDWKQYNTEKE